MLGVVIIEGEEVKACGKCPHFRRNGKGPYCVIAGFEIADPEIVDEDCLFVESNDEEDEEIDDDEDIDDDGFDDDDDY